MRKYETDFKLKVVKRFLDGDGVAKLLAPQWSVPVEKIRTWVSHFRLHDIEPKIRATYEEHRGRYGYRRITAALSNSMAEPVNHKCVQGLM
jgi:transposase-like protein